MLVDGDLSDQMEVHAYREELDCLFDKRDGQDPCDTSDDPGQCEIGRENLRQDICGLLGAYGGTSEHCED